jgi:DNA-binding NtrC family response regulator
MEALIQEMLDGKILLAEAVGEFEKIYIEKALAQNGGHFIKTSAALGIHRNTLSKRENEYDSSNGHRSHSKAKSRRNPAIKTKGRFRR